MTRYFSLILMTLALAFSSPAAQAAEGASLSTLFCDGSLAAVWTSTPPDESTLPGAAASGNARVLELGAGDERTSPRRPGRVLELGAGDERARSSTYSGQRVLELGAGDERAPLCHLLDLLSYVLIN